MADPQGLVGGTSGAQRPEFFYAAADWAAIEALGCAAHDRILLEGICEEYLTAPDRVTFNRDMAAHVASAERIQEAAYRLAEALENSPFYVSPMFLEELDNLNVSGEKWAEVAEGDKLPTRAQPDRRSFMSALLDYWKSRGNEVTGRSRMRADWTGADDEAASEFYGPTVDFLCAAANAACSAKGQPGVTAAMAQHAVRDYQQRESRLAVERAAIDPAEGERLINEMLNMAKARGE